MHARLSSLLLLLPLTACVDGLGLPLIDGGPGAGRNNEPSPVELFDGTVTDVVIEIDYAEGAEPYDAPPGPLADGRFSLVDTQLSRLFADTNVTVELPGDDELEALGPLDGDEFDTARILALASEHRDVASDATTSSYYAIWLDGFFADGSGRREEVLGVSLGDTHVLAMFKPVIDGAGGGPAAERFVEQTVFVHELGHAMGLVNNGVPLVAEHHDEEHGAHCTNEDCVMYWAHEGAGALVDFVLQQVASGDTVVFGAECLDDVDALKP